MSTSNLVRLGDYRDRRERRLHRARVLYDADPERSAVVEHLGDVLAVVGGDRAAAVWVDEYGPGLVHVHSVVDLASGPPRRAFAVSHLKGAWESGIPGLLDFPDIQPSGLVFQQDPPRSQAVVSLGSDGARAWFVVADSRTPRAPLTQEASELLMFFAGEVASVLLHRDLPDREGTGAGGSAEKLRKERFAGWPILQDIEGREEDRQATQRISCRFMVARVVRRLIEDDFAVDREAFQSQLDGVREELAGGGDDVPVIPSSDPERMGWDEVLDAAERMELRALAGAVLRLGNAVEDLGHLHGARELHRCAYDIAVAGGSLPAAVDALRFHARTYRKLGELRVADHWYDRALALADALGEPKKLALVLTGHANVRRQVGNLPGARELLRRQMEVAEESGSADALAQCHHGWLAVEKDARNWPDAVVHGWEAFRLYEDEATRLIVLTDLAWSFALSGSPRSAEHAFAVVAGQAEYEAIRVIALEGLAYVAALRGDRAAFEQRLAVADGQRAGLPPIHRSEAAYFRALSYEILGEVEAGIASLQEARTLAEGQEVNKVALEAEERLRSLQAQDTEVRTDRTWEPLEDQGDPKIAEVSQGLAELRAATVG